MGRAWVETARETWVNFVKGCVNFLTFAKCWCRGAHTKEAAAMPIELVVPPNRTIQATEHFFLMVWSNVVVKCLVIFFCSYKDRMLHAKGCDRWMRSLLIVCQRWWECQAMRTTLKKLCEPSVRREVGRANPSLYLFTSFVGCAK